METNLWKVQLILLLFRFVLIYSNVEIDLSQMIHFSIELYSCFLENVNMYVYPRQNNFSDIWYHYHYKPK